jgi:type II secretory ATPase GspE/PulE/Tfp pilus assembly ATPase PilB-like protein
MPGKLICILVAAAWALVDAAPLAAQINDPWPNVGLPPEPLRFPRGPGYYYAVWKLALAWGLFAAWVKSTDWISQDCLQRKFHYVLWNSVAFFPFLAAFILHWLIPWFWVGLFLLLVAYGVPLVLYVRFRNAQLEPHQRVFTRQHLRFLTAQVVNRVGGKMSAEKKTQHELGPDVKLTARGAANERDDNVNLLTARQSPGFLLTRELLFDAYQRRADGVALDYSEQTVAVKYLLDGVWHDYAQQERAHGDLILAVMKKLANLNVEDRRSKQSGSFGAEIDKQKLTCRLTSQGTAAGENVVVVLSGRKSPFKTLDDLGMRPKMQEQLVELLGRKSGFFLVSALPGGGLTTTFDLVLERTDRYLRSFVSVEDEARHERDIENLPATRYNAAAGETPATVLPKLIREYPDALVVRDLVNAETVEILCGQVTEENRQVFASVRAKEAVEALLRVLLLKVPPAKFAAAVTAVLNQRLVRKLCEQCREAYAPPPEVLKQLGLPAGKIEALYRPPTQPIDPKHPEKVCEHCLGVGYFGRTSIFELLLVDDAMRNLLATAPKPELLRAAARQARHRSLAEEGLLLLAKGVTSLPELQRVLKQ